MQNQYVGDSRFDTDLCSEDLVQEYIPTDQDYLDMNTIFDHEWYNGTCEICGQETQYDKCQTCCGYEDNPKLLLCIDIDFS